MEFLFFAWERIAVSSVSWINLDSSLQLIDKICDQVLGALHRFIPVIIHHMTALRWCKILQQWKYFSERQPQYAFPFLHCRFLSLGAQVCQNQFMSKEEFYSTRKFDSHVYARMLQQYLRMNEPIRGKVLHCHSVKMGNCLDLVAQNILLNKIGRAHV